VGEHDRALGRERLAELDGVDSCDQPRKRRPTLLQRRWLKIVALEAEKVEGDKRGFGLGGVGKDLMRCL